MLSIYSNAYLTIAADHAKNGEKGCFAPSANKPFIVGQIHLPETFQFLGKAFIRWDSDGLDIDHNHFIQSYRNLSPSNLSARGWTLQERLLSRRIVHYTSCELVWECRQDLQCQCGRLSYTNTKTIMQSFHDRLHVGAQKSDLIELWMNIAEEYSRRSLTYKTDKLVALKGLAERFQINGLHGYISGNWIVNIRNMLLWRSHSDGSGCRRHTEYIAPSWSWASSPSRIVFDSLEQSRSNNKNKDGLKRRYLARIDSITTKAGPSGQLIWGCLIVVGQTVILKPIDALFEAPLGKSGKFYECMWYLACEISSTVCTAHPDYQCEFETMLQSGQKVTGLLWDVILDRTRVLEDIYTHESQYSSHIIILQQDPEDETLYRRVGIACINWSFHDKNAPPPAKIEGMNADWGLGKDWFKNAPLKRITIV